MDNYNIGLSKPDKTSRYITETTKIIKQNNQSNKYPKQPTNTQNITKLSSNLTDTSKKSIYIRIIKVKLIKRFKTSTRPYVN